jgi:hypothetical protein
VRGLFDVVETEFMGKKRAQSSFECLRVGLSFEVLGVYHSATPAPSSLLSGIGRAPHSLAVCIFPGSVD